MLNVKISDCVDFFLFVETVKYETITFKIC